MFQPNGGISNVNKPRIEIKTLTQEVCKDSDQILQALMNEGWQVLGAPGYTSVTVPNVSGPGWRIKHFEVIKLWRRVEQQPSDPLKAATNYSSVVERLHEMASPPTPLRAERGEQQVICGLPGGPQGMRPPIDEVTFLEALQSGQYTAEEISAIGDRENAERFFSRITKRQAQTTGARFAPPPTNKRTALLSQ